MLDTLDRPNRIRRIQVRGICGPAPDEQLWHALVFLKEPHSAGLALAQNLEAAKLPSRLHRLIIFPREDREGQSLGCFLSRSLARENTIADRHGEVRGFGAVPELDVGFDFCESLFCLGDVTGQVANLPSDVTLLVCMNCAQLVELADFSVDLDFFDDGRISGSDCFDLCVRESATVEVLGRPDRRFTAHNLVDKARLGFQRLPHVRVEGALGHIAVDLYLFISVALTQYPAFTLLDIAWAPWCIQMMKRHKPSLHVGSGAHLFSRPEKYPHPARIHSIKKHLLGGISLCVMNESNLSGRNAG